LEEAFVSTVFTYPITIIERHLDTFGHVNNATYLELYEEARWDFITKRGYSLERVQQEKLGPVLLDLHLTFKRELRNRQLIHIQSRYVERRGNLFMKLEQSMLSEEGKVLSTLEVNVGMMDLTQRKLVPPSDDWLKAIGALEY
jgi:acyl-CoA thioester hydrolase